jgi:hypothetical protein
MKLHVAEDLSLPLDWMTLATVVYGARGSGKTTLGSVLAEEVTKAKQRFCAIDLKGDWYGLKSTADGRDAGIPVVIFGGDHADLPLEEGAGAFVGETIAALEQPSIVDLEHFSKGKQVRFLAAFFESLYDRNREPLLLLLDEAQRYAPQSGGRGVDPIVNTCLGAVEDLVKLGRKHGIGPVLFTQRGSGLNKEVSELCDMLVAFRTPGPLDQGRVKDWLEANRTREDRDRIMGMLAGLDTGTAVFASGHPALKLFKVAHVRPRETFDSSATPKIGQSRREPKQLATPDLEKIRERMAGAIERAKQDDPKALRAEITELKRQLKAAGDTKPVPPVIERVEVPVLDEKAFRQISAMEEALEHLTDRMSAFHSTLSTVERVVKSAPAPVARRAAPVAPRQVPARPATASGNGQAKLGRGERSILIALAQYSGGRSLTQVAILTGYSSKGGRFKNILSFLRGAGYIIGTEQLEITDSGLSALGAWEPLPTGDALLVHWRSKLAPSEGRVLEVIAQVYPGQVTADEVASMTGYEASGGRFKNILSYLRTLELIEGRNELRASEALFG